jgi:hypothetical protein
MVMQFKDNALWKLDQGKAPKRTRGRPEDSFQLVPLLEYKFKPHNFI